MLGPVLAAILLAVAKADAEQASGACMLSKTSPVPTLLEVNGDAEKTTLGGHSGELQPMMEFVTTQAAMMLANKSNYSMSTEVRNALQIFMNYITQMQADIGTLHNADQADINEALGMAQNCSTSHTGASAVDTARNAHAQCRENQKNSKTNETTQCTTYANARANNAPPSCELVNSRLNNHPAFDACLKQFYPWAKDLYDKLMACEASKNTTTSIGNKCDSNQTQFENAVCNFHSGFCTCQTTTRTHYQTRKGAITTAESLRKVDYQSGEKIRCYVNVLIANSTTNNITQMFNNCNQNSVDVTNLTVNYGSLPAMVTQCNDTLKPCDTAWVSREYTSKTWYSTAPTKPCTPCSTR